MLFSISLWPVFHDVNESRHDPGRSMVGSSAIASARGILYGKVNFCSAGEELSVRSRAQINSFISRYRANVADEKNLCDDNGFSKPCGLWSRAHSKGRGDCTANIAGR